MNSKKLLIVVNVDWFFISHRLCIAEKAQERGWEVFVACTDTGRSKEITNKGINFINLSFSRSSTSVLDELNTLYSFYKLYKKIKPDIVHHVTLKPVIYGSVISRLTKIKGTVNAISGLGYNFTDNRKGPIQNVMIKLMKLGFDQKKVAFIFQNQDDFKEVKSLKVLGKNNIVFFIKGSGVDLNTFIHSPFIETGKVKILLPVRMLWDKGVAELKKASEILKEKYQKKIVFILSGLADTENKAGVTEDYLKSWEDKEYVVWIGYQKKMIEVYQNSDIVVLPSYREGMPKSLLEACAIGRPIVTTNAIGCKECVDEGINGYKVPVRSVEKLAIAIEKLILSKELRLEMGKNSRIKAENEFSQKMVISKHLEIYNNLYES